MLSPDPVTQAPENGQNYNRYSYGYNNPLTYTDPTGYETKKKTVLVDGNSAHSAGRMEYVYVTASAPSPRFVGNQAALTFAGSSGNSPRNAPGDRVETNGAPKPSQAPVDDDPATIFDESTCENTGCVTVYGLLGGGQLTLGRPSIDVRPKGATSKSRFVIFPWFKASNFYTGYQPTASTYDLIARDNRAATLRNAGIAANFANYGSMALGVGGAARGLVSLAARNPKAAALTVELTISTFDAAGVAVGTMSATSAVSGSAYGAARVLVPRMRVPATVSGSKPVISPNMRYLLD